MLENIDERTDDRRPPFSSGELKKLLILPIQQFEADFLWPQNPEFRNNPEHFHPCIYEPRHVISNNVAI